LTTWFASRGSKALGIEVGDYARVERVDAKSNQVIIRTDADGALSYDPRRLQGVTLYRETERAFAAGDRQMTAPDRGRGVPKRSAFQIIPACLLLATRTYCRKASPLDVGRCFTLRSDSVSSSTQTPSAPPAIREATSVLSAFVVGTPLAALAALSIANSFIGHMTPDISIYLLHARTFVETLNRFTLSWDFKGIMVMFVLALPVRVFGATMGAAAFAQLCACVVGFCFLFCVARSYADRWSSTLLVLLATCVIFSNHILGGRVRPENFALACCTGCLYAGLRAKPRWWIAGGAMTAFCLFLKITLVLAPGATMVAAAVADAVDQVSPRSKRWPLFLPTLTRNSLWILLGFATVAGAALAWIAAFDDLAQSYRQTVVYPMQVRAAGGYHLSLFMNPVNLLQQSNLSFLFAGCIPGLLYGWFRGFRRQALLAGVLLLTEVVRVAVEGSPYPYLVTIMVMPMLLGVAFFGSAKTNSTAAMLAWIAPLYLLAPLLIPTVREQVKTFELRVVKGLPAPYEYLAQQMRERYRPSESIFVVGSSEEIVLLLNAPRPFPITYDYLLTPLSEEERRRTLKQYEEQPPDWIIRREPERSPVRFTTLGNVDAAYHVYLPAAISIQSGDSAKHEDTPTRVGSSLAPVGSVSRQYWLEVDTGYLQAWHLLKNGA
jgi:hypothetical protein